MRKASLRTKSHSNVFFAALPVLFASFAGFLACAPALAASTANFPFGQPRAMITVQTPSLGPADKDANILFEAMDVPVKDSFVGRGKTIQYGDNVFTQICAIRSGEVYTCTFLIQSSPVSKVDSFREVAEFHLTGAEADQLVRLIKPNQGGTFEFEAVDGKLKISARPGDLHVRFTGK